MSYVLRSIVTLLLLPMALSAVAQEEAALVDISACMALENDSERLQCYNRLEEQVRTENGRPPSAREAQETAPADRGARSSVSVDQPEAQQAGAGEQDSVERFGARPPAARVVENASGQEELIDTIAGLRERVPGKWLITLESGQVWVQVNSKRYRLREGDTVRIYPSPMGGSWRLSAERLNAFIQVRRVE